MSYTKEMYDNWVLDKLEPDNTIASQGGSIAASVSRRAWILEGLEQAGAIEAIETEAENNARQDAYLKQCGIY